MADESTPSKRRKRRSAGGRNKLRRHVNIESVIVEEPFSLSVPSETSASLKLEAGIKEGNLAGDGYYVSATNNSSRYYGLLVSQEALKAASLLHFQEEARSLDLNRRIRMKRQQEDGGDDDVDDNDTKEPATKRPKVDLPPPIKMEPSGRSIQKLQYVIGGEDTKEPDPGYRILIATYINSEVASEGDADKASAIAAACESGGDWVGDFYYQFESLASRLESQKAVEKATDVGLRTSMGFQNFLQDTPLPIWFPLSNLQLSQHKVLSMLQMKRNKKGGIVWNKGSDATAETSQGTHLPMDERSHFRVGVVGGGLAGLACAKELLRLSTEQGINVEVVIMEGRSRLGGRLLTDTSTFTFQDGSNFPVDLGASWIHGIDHNPLAALAEEANVDFVTASEEVHMISESLKPVDRVVDEKMGKLFDKLLDQAADDLWDSPDFVPDGARSQNAVRWYAEKLDHSKNGSDLTKTDAPPHRQSSDVSIDHAVGRAVKNHNHREFRKFGPQENSLLLWNIKNVEYALGANIADLSMKFWDSDERHAFEGDHVMMKQGYGSVVDHLHKELLKSGDKFKCELGFHVGKIEYARKTTTASYPLSQYGYSRKVMELSDTCSVSSKDGTKIQKFDFLISTLPLGVLKQSVTSVDADTNSTRGVAFDPPLPFPKVDAITNAGFGLLNKVYIQFPVAFWRLEHVLTKDQTLFGNASGLNPHHYMFFDIGKSLGKSDDKPAILMTLISGKEAVECELMSDSDLVQQVLETLEKLFSSDTVPKPTASKVTRWGADPFSRGCYAFLPPGASDQDFQILQSPINGNGDSLMLEGSETMRLFWAGEHTTTMHPSMAHGALLSGQRAAKEVMSAMSLNSSGDKASFEKIIPIAMFRKKNPTAKLQCSLCHQEGGRVREGGLLAFQKGARQVLVHNNCGENSPEVEVRDGRWNHVIKAVNRGKQINCCMCGSIGATIGCTDKNCFRCFHFLCAEDTGWRFDRDGKVYFCDQHRDHSIHGDNECDQISIKFYRTKRPYQALVCSFCGVTGSDSRRGDILAFAQRRSLMLVHDKCARYTTIMETLDDFTSLTDTNFKSLFDVHKRSKSCSSCGKFGGTVLCSEMTCDKHYHFTCAQDSGWDFDKKGIMFRCPAHRKGGNTGPMIKKAESSNPVDKNVAKPVAFTLPFLQLAQTKLAKASTGEASSQPVPGRTAQSNGKQSAALPFLQQAQAKLAATMSTQSEREKDHHGVESSNEATACKVLEPPPIGNQSAALPFLQQAQAKLAASASAQSQPGKDQRGVASSSETTASKDHALPTETQQSTPLKPTNGGDTTEKKLPAGLFQHNLFFSGAERVNRNKGMGDVAVNDEVWDRKRSSQPAQTSQSFDSEVQESDDDDDESSVDEQDAVNPMLMSLGIPNVMDGTPVRFERKSYDEPWSFTLCISPDYVADSNLLMIEYQADQSDESKIMMSVLEVDKMKVGSPGLGCVQEIVAHLRASTEVNFSVRKL